jgi:hypothetical protein
VPPLRKAASYSFVIRVAAVEKQFPVGPAKGDAAAHFPQVFPTRMIRSRRQIFESGWCSFDSHCSSGYRLRFRRLSHERFQRVPEQESESRWPMRIKEDAKIADPLNSLVEAIRGDLQRHRKEG